jgi:asparagine N-glycosylation enzyme membrane subunit Stt3
MTESTHKNLIRISIALILIIIAVAIAFEVRTGPQDMSGLDEQVERSLYQNIRNQIANDVRQQNPGLPDTFIDDQIDQQYRAYLDQPGINDQIRQAAQAQAEDQRAYFTNPDTGRMYMSDLDPYYFVRYAENILETGMPGDSVRDGEQWDDRMLAPVGRPVETLRFHNYFLAGFHRILSSFDQDMDVLLSASWYPPIIFSIIVILTFLIATAISNPWGGFIAALAIATLPGTLGRTMFGRSDTDTWTILFPVLGLYLFLEAFETKQLWAKLTLASLAGLIVGLFSWAWTGWWYLPVFIYATIGVYFAYRFIEHWVRERAWERTERIIPSALIASIILIVLTFIVTRLINLNLVFSMGIALGAGFATLFAISAGLALLSRDAKHAFAQANRNFWEQKGVWQPIAFTGAFTVIAGLSIVLVQGFSALLSPLRVLTFSNIRAPTRDIFPNVYTTVAELNPGGSLANVYRSIVGQITYPLGTVHGTIALFITITLAGLLIYAGMRILKKNDYIPAVSAILSGAFFGFIALAALFGASDAAGQTTRSVGLGFVLVGLAFFGIIGSLIGRKTQDGFDVRYGILLTVWLVATAYATHLGIRFALLLAPPFAIAVGIGAGYLMGIVSKAFVEEKELVTRIGPAAGVIISILVLVFFMPGTVASPSGESGFGWRGLYGQAQSITQLDLPLVDDTWYELYTAVRNETAQDTIITSWWDFGHHFKYYMDRQVTFDGASQNSPNAHWVGNLLITRSEKQSIGTLRMLACSNHYGFEAIDETILNDSFETLRLTKTIIAMNTSDARSWLETEGYDAEEIDFILERTHCEARPNLVIASGDMVGKAGVWGHFGSWNFERADVHNDVRSGMSRAAATTLIQERLNVSYAEAIDTYTLITGDQPTAQRWIADYPSYLGEAACDDQGNDTITCRVQSGTSFFTLRINTSEQRAYADLGQGEQPVPFGMLENDTFIVSDVEAPQLNAGFSLSANRASVIISSPEHVGSVFARMYHYDGAGLECYEPFLYQQWPRGGKINTYEANWSCAEKLG